MKSCQNNPLHLRTMKRKSTDVCYKCGHTGHWAHECELGIDAKCQRPGKVAKVAKHKIYLDVKYCEKDEAKCHGAKWDHAAKKWFVFERVPEALKRFAPKPTYVFVKPEDSDDSDTLCRYCCFSFEEELERSTSDPKACIYCVEKKQPPQCRECNKFMVSDCWKGDEDDPSIRIIHDCAGTPLMYGDSCSGCPGFARATDRANHQWRNALWEFEDLVKSHGVSQEVVKDAMENSIPGTFPDLRILRIVHDRKCRFKLQQELHEAAVKELSAEFPEFEVIPDSLFYPHNSDTKRGVPAGNYGLHFKIGKVSDDTRIKDFIMKMGTVMIPDGVPRDTSGYLPRVFKRLSKTPPKTSFGGITKPRPWILFGRGEGNYILIDTDLIGGVWLENHIKGRATNGYIKLN